MSFFRKSGIVNVRMVITEEKILSNIDKIQKLINPNSKKQIIQLEEDSYFKDLIESVKTYLLEYPQKKNFPIGVYKAAYGLVEYATNQFEENTKKIEELIRKREKNISLAEELRETLTAVKTQAEGWEEDVENLSDGFSDDIIGALKIIGNQEEENEDAIKLVEARINNLESNLHIEIDMERIDDRSKALSFIGIEIAEALKYIPAPIEGFINHEEAEPEVNSEVLKPVEAKSNKVAVAEKVSKPVANVAAAQMQEEEQRYIEETRFEVKPSLWQRIKNSKLVRKISYIMKIRVVLDMPALPEGRGENN